MNFYLNIPLNNATNSFQIGLMVFEKIGIVLPKCPVIRHILHVQNQKYEPIIDIFISQELLKIQIPNIHQNNCLDKLIRVYEITFCSQVKPRTLRII